MDATNENLVTEEEPRDLGNKLKVSDRALSPFRRVPLRYAPARADQDAEE
jgi:hypothetical protein